MRTLEFKIDDDSPQKIAPIAPVTPPTATKKKEKKEEEELIRSNIEESGDEELIHSLEEEMEMVEEQMLRIDCGEDPCV
jgi:uncharacterized protein YpiB (UPF0302 family)